jgi:hypothetical protein
VSKCLQGDYSLPKKIKTLVQSEIQNQGIDQVGLKRCQQRQIVIVNALHLRGSLHLALENYHYNALASW